MCEADKSAGSAVGSVLIENARTRVTEWRFPAKGDNTGWHLHEHDYVVVPLADGQLELREPGGQTRFAELRKGVPYFREKGARHDVVNYNAFEFAFIEIEFLDGGGS
ncbi:cupin domain-containing protein [Thioclava sp. IC9]|uniref:cupin domain-containing protein n=1 Tax=Thioclava sp. IC9 TaxID=1973007 RepID=UPI000B53ACDA|nr:cupin domain-containing protein [Thioclava sp. IC9]OWY06336.1 cupin [Thioclava sp. IC9]